MQHTNRLRWSAAVAAAMLITISGPALAGPQAILAQRIKELRDELTDVQNRRREIEKATMQVKTRYEQAHAETEKAELAYSDARQRYSDARQAESAAIAAARLRLETEQNLTELRDVMLELQAQFEAMKAEIARAIATSPQYQQAQASAAAARRHLERLRQRRQHGAAMAQAAQAVLDADAELDRLRVEAMQDHPECQVIEQKLDDTRRTLFARQVQIDEQVREDPHRLSAYQQVQAAKLALDAAERDLTLKRRAESTAQAMYDRAAGELRYCDSNIARLERKILTAERNLAAIKPY